MARSAEFEKQLHEGKKLPFTEIIPCNIGNPHALKQPPVSFVRDVLSLVVNPTLSDRNPTLFPADVVDRAKKYLTPTKKGLMDMGAYSDSKGIGAVREEVSKFLLERDGFAGNVNDIFLTNGASEGVRLCMTVLTRPNSEGFKDGVLTPIPQYPLYSALTTVLDANLVPYYLDEEQNWSCSREQLEESFKKGAEGGIETRALVVINPGNPTGQVLEESVMRNIIEFCMEKGIILMADEVYQENIWASGSKFSSFRKVAHEMGALKGDDDGLHLINFHSVSKGFLGECGLRGGYFEMLGIPQEVKDQIYKLASISLCSNTMGQITTGLMVQPPVEGEPSFSLYKKEKDDILGSMHRRAILVARELNKLEGVQCSESQGAMYAFPTIVLPQGAISAAKEAGMEPDAFYCWELLNATGIVLVPGSGFKQKEETFHFRITILPPEEQMDKVFDLIGTFHNSFYAQYK